LDREHKINLDELMLSSHGLVALCMPFTEEEMWRTICELPSDKAPGPDWFIGRLYKSCWQVIKRMLWLLSLCYAVETMVIWGCSIQSISFFFPKKEEALHIKDF